jgi:hypothetical protein
MAHSSDAFRLLSAARAQSQRARQFSKIEELVEAVKSAGFVTLDEQAKALGLSRSTAWTIRKASHKASGLSASIISRMLAAPELAAFNPRLAGVPRNRIHSRSGAQRHQRCEWREVTAFWWLFCPQPFEFLQAPLECCNASLSFNVAFGIPHQQTGPPHAFRLRLRGEGPRCRTA